MGPIVVLGAVAPEIEPLRGALENEEAQRRSGVDLYRGRLRGIDVVLLRSGPGKVCAAAAAQLAIDLFQPRYMLMTGACGSLDPQVGLGDVLLAERLVPHDLAWVTAQGALRDGVPYTDAEGHTFRLASLAADAKLLATVQEVVASLELPAPAGKERRPRVLRGTVASGDQFIANAVKRHWLRETFGALGCEREGLAAAQVALSNRIPFLMIKGVSDPADETLDLDPSRLLLYQDQHTLDDAYRRLATGETLPTPIGPRMRADFRYAAANAALVVWELITALEDD